MITKEELLNYAKKRSLNLGQAEVDYFQHLILFIIYSRVDFQMVFKGGTALQKCYSLERFSEDLDFNLEKDADVLPIIESGLKDFLLNFEIELNEHPKGKNYLIRIEGPLHNGNRNSLCKILLDLSFREPTILNTSVITMAKTINEIPSFQISVMNIEEIFAEKIRAILTRDKARDIYDLYFLLNQNISQDKNLVNKKLEFNKLVFSKDKIIEKIEKTKRYWDAEMKPLLNNFIEFEEVLENIKIKLNS